MKLLEAKVNENKQNKNYKEYCYAIMLPWRCTIKILFTCCTLCPTALPLAVPHELFSASWWGWRDYGQVQGSPAVSGPLPLPIEMLYVYYLSENWELSG